MNLLSKPVDPVFPVAKIIPKIPFVKMSIKNQNKKWHITKNLIFVGSQKMN